MGIKCFLIEEINERHEPYGPPEEGHYHRLFDVRRADTGEILLHDTYFIHNVPPGAMWWEHYVDGWFPKGPEDHFPGSLPEHRKHPTDPSFLFADGPCLCVMTPGGVWRIDSRASNCTMPYDYEHRCWVRHGTPPTITVNKAGKTCAAGAGSIQCGSYHGFLVAGELT